MTDERDHRYVFSLLQFHRRVLENAFDARHPICLRLMFLQIVSKNLDEFYMKVFPHIGLDMDSDAINNPYRPDSESYDDVVMYIYDLIERIDDVTIKVLKDLDRNGVYIKKTSELNKEEFLVLDQFFHSRIKPFLTPTILDATHPFPLVPSGVLSVIYKFSQASTTTHATHMVIVLTPNVKKLIKLSDVPLVYIYIEDVMEHYIRHFTPPNCTIEDSCFFKLIRDSNVKIEEDMKNMSLDSFNVIKRRRSANVVKIFTSTRTSTRMINYLKHIIHVQDDDIMKIKYNLGLDGYFNIISEDRPDLSYQSLVSRYPKRISDFQGDYFKAITEKDIIVHQPFESFDVFLGFLHQAATDPNVILIKQTLYRTTPNSQVVKELISASENGKQVVVLIELRASMDEDNNIMLAKLLEENGVQVIYGTLNYKTHAKLCIVVRTNEHSTEEFLHIGTGNYHPINAKIYTDLSLFTANPEMCNEANDVFNFITGSIVPKKTCKLFVSPLNLKETLISHIKEEIKNKKNGKYAEIWLKCNALTDKNIIKALYEASRAGVTCQLIVRGICALRPGIPGLSENITIKSIVGRYLEHSRIYCFASGYEMPSDKNTAYISSADLMSRNLDYRIEIMAIIENKTVHKQVINEIFYNYLRDTKNSWLMRSDGTYKYMGNNEELEKNIENFDAHDYFLTHESVSGHGLDI